MITQERDIGDRFQEETSYAPGKLGAHRPNWTERPGLYHEYPQSQKVALPSPRPLLNMTLYESLRRRRSQRRFTHEPMILEQVSYLLWAGNGLQRQEEGFEYRTAPSAGALYPLETYLVANNVTGLAHGLYHYAVRGHTLELLRGGDFRKEIARAALEQEMCAQADIVIALSAVFARSKWKYGARAYRYVYLDAGHVGQNLLLAAATLELGACPVGAIYDTEMDRLFALDGDEESIVYLIVVGHSR